MNNFLGEMMKYKKTIATIAIAAAFGTGIVLADNNTWQGSPNLSHTRSIIDQLGDKLTAQSNKITSLSTQTTTAQNQLTDAQNNVSNMQSQLTSLQNQLTQAKETLPWMKTKVSRPV